MPARSLSNLFRQPRKLLLTSSAIAITTLVLLTLPTPASAAPGINQIINFQGKVTNADGTNVADGAYDFVFKMYSGASSGSPTLFTETWASGSLFSSTMTAAPAASGESLTYSSNTNEATLQVGQILWNTTKKESVKVTAVNTGTNVLGISPTRQAWATTDTITNRIYVKSGLFTASINSLNKDLSGVDFNADSIYLGINFNNDGEMKPRIQYSAVPYAFNSQKVNGVTVTNTSGGTPTTGTTLKIADGKTVAFNGGLTFAGTDGKTLTVNNSLTFGGTDGTTFTLPTSSDTLVGIAAAQTLTNKTLSGLTISGTTTLSGYTANGGILYTNGSGVLAQTTAGSAGECLQSIGGGTPTWGACGSGGSVTADSLDFTEFKDAMALDAATSINLGSNTLSTSGTGGINFNNTGANTIAGTVTIGSGGNTITFDAGTGTTYAGTARPSKIVDLFPEYPNSAISTDGSTSTNGTLITDNGQNAGSNAWRNYYEWTSTQGTLQDYSIMVNVTLPKDFDSWETGACPGTACALELNYMTGTASTADNAVSVKVNNNSDTPGTAICTIADSASTSWAKVGCTSATLASGSAPQWNSASTNPTAVIRIKLKAKNTASALTRVSNITLRYKAKF